MLTLASQHGFGTASAAGIGMACIAEQHFGHVLRAEDEVSHPRFDQAARHGGELRRVGVLCDADPADRLHRPRPGGSVRPHPAHGNGDGPFPLLFGQGAEKVIHGPAMARLLQRLAEPEGPVFDGERAARADDVHVVRLDRGAILHLLHRHGGALGEDIDHHAVALRRQVLDQHEGHAAVRRMALKNSVYASKPPADAPMPTTGNGKRGACSPSTGSASRSGWSSGCGPSVAGCGGFPSDIQCSCPESATCPVAITENCTPILVEFRRCRDGQNGSQIPQNDFGA